MNLPCPLGVSQSTIGVVGESRPCLVTVFQGNIPNIEYVLEQTSVCGLYIFCLFYPVRYLFIWQPSNQQGVMAPNLPTPLPF
jgi:hypothetical protein